jgi:hypothetical protein
VFETAGLHLFVEVHRQELQALVDRFEAGHFGPPSAKSVRGMMPASRSGSA